MDALSSRYPFSQPWGWFQVARTNDVATGTMTGVRLHGRDLVLARGESGRLGLVDAYCPHQGAKLDEGGQVEGDCVRCPFHSWEFDVDGRCTKVPFQDRVPHG